MIVAEALKRAGGVDRVRVLDEVQNMAEYQGVSGPVRFDTTGERVGAPASFYQVRKTDEGREMDYLGITSDLLSPED
jgi:ABC-type branched-subunit amino acid transport system substrate-binding protein